MYSNSFRLEFDANSINEAYGKTDTTLKKKLSFLSAKIW